MADPIRKPACPIVVWSVVMTALLSGTALAQTAGPASGEPADPPPAAAEPAAPAPPDEVLPRLEDLPYADRRDLPPLKFSMFRWHEDPGQRFVVFKERRVGEDGVLGQELWLREIRPDGVVLDFRGKRFFVAK